jgi:lipopolysaccharide transport system permease protein
VSVLVKPESDDSKTSRSLPSFFINPERGWPTLELKELWEYRELLFFFTWRDIKVRYKQTALGAAWAIIQPFFLMVVFSLFLGRLAHVPSDGVPYPIFVYAGLLPWQLFSQSLIESSNSLITNERLITKVYFPRLCLPMSAVMAGLVDFAIAFAILILMMVFYGVRPTTTILFLPAFVLLAASTALAIGLWLSAFNARYRDVRYTINFLIQFWLFATPVAYPSSLIPLRWRALYGLNPMAGVVEGFRWSLLGRNEPPGPILAVSMIMVLLLLIGGLYYFRHTEAEVADLI